MTLNTCEEHGDAIVVYDGWNCPACEAIDDLMTEHGKTVADLEQQINEGDEKIGELETELEEAKADKK